MKKSLAVGDYVLGTRWSDGDSREPFCVGFIVEIFEAGRYAIADNKGKRFSGTYRRAERISQERGAFIVANISHIEQGVRSVWWWKRTNLKNFPIQPV